MTDTAAMPALSAPVRQRPLGTTALRVLCGLVIVAVWEIVVRLFGPAYVAKPSGVILAIPKVFDDPAFLAATSDTLTAVAEGLAISLVLGTVLGLAMGRSVVADRALRHYVNACNALPMVVVLPLLSLWFGYTGAARLATTVFAAVFSIIINVADGARSVPQDYLEVARSFRSGRLRALVDIVVPAALPYFLAGFRLAAGRALIGAVVAEFFTAIGGLGYFILFQSRTFHHNEAFVGVLLLAAFGVGFEVVVNASTRRFLPWYRHGERSE
jgi:ABC-type nitrate/sulfonate/bicarbonate transport system permease component